MTTSATDVRGKIKAAIIAYGVNDHESYSAPECIGPFDDEAVAEAYIVEHSLRADPKVQVEIWPVMTSDEFVASLERAAKDFASGRGTVLAKGERPSPYDAGLGPLDKRGK